MKSIIEEASSIVKAIEAAWIRAEKPQEFSVKIFEEPEKNFFGMVTKSAKIALIFKHVEKKQSKDAGSKYKPNNESPIFNTQTKEYRKEHPRREHAPREQREDREYQDRREPREPRERYDRDHQERRELREHREPRERQERYETREPRERQDAREEREHRERREPREYREQRDQERREQRQEARELREPRENRDHQERREQREPMVRELTRKESAPKPAPMHEQEQLSFVAHDAVNTAEQQQGPEKIFWTEEMINATQAWIETLLKNMNSSDISFTLEPKRYYLSISFNKPVRSTKALEQQLFRSCAYLIMQMLRTKMKKQYRGLKVVLSSPTPSQDA